jgi:hypothetical protein
MLHATETSIFCDSGVAVLFKKSRWSANDVVLPNCTPRHLDGFLSLG